MSHKGRCFRDLRKTKRRKMRQFKELQQKALANLYSIALPKPIEPATPKFQRRI